MTKRNLTLGTASGKLGSVVYFRRRGQQIARVLISSINDPRTLAQCRQRARFANYVTSWRFLRQFVDNSWRGVSRYGSHENAYYKHNRLLMPPITKEMSRQSSALPPLGIITYGALNTSFNAYNGYTNWQSEGVGRECQYIRYTAATSLPTTTGEFIDALLASNMGVMRGDILHFVEFSFMWSSNPSDMVAVMQDFQPRVLHHELDTSDTSVPFNVAFPWWRLVDATLPSGERVLPLVFNNGFSPIASLSGNLATAWAVYVERPGNPQYSRFQRSRFAMFNEARDWLVSICGTSILANAIAYTYRNV